MAVSAMITLHRRLGLAVHNLKPPHYLYDLSFGLWTLIDSLIQYET
jgi:hypothetical protein